MGDYARMAGLDLVIPADDFDPLESQRELQEKIFATKTGEGHTFVRDHSRAAETVGELLARMRFNHEAYCAEHQEMLDFLPWKEWKTYDLEPVNSVEELGETLTELKFEAVDKLHFLMNDFINLGMTWEDVMVVYATKQAENRARQERGY